MKLLVRRVHAVKRPKHLKLTLFWDFYLCMSAQPFFFVIACLSLQWFLPSRVPVYLLAFFFFFQCVTRSICCWLINSSYFRSLQEASPLLFSLLIFCHAFDFVNVLVKIVSCYNLYEFSNKVGCLFWALERKCFSGLRMVEIAHLFCVTFPPD